MDPEQIGSLLVTLLPDLEELARERETGHLPAEDLQQEGCLALSEFLAGEEELSVTTRELLELAGSAMDRAVSEAMEAEHRQEQLILQVELLNQSIDRLTEEIGEKPNIDELANDLGVTQEKVLDILKLTGDEMDEDALRPPTVRTFRVGGDS